LKAAGFKSLGKYFKSNETKFSYLFILLFSLIITILLIWINTSQEILGNSYRDIYFYLIESLRFSGYSIGGYEYVNYLSPLIPFLTSLLFRLGFVNETSIFLVTGIFYILGVLGIYSLLRLRFRNLMALFGAILYTGLSINLMWVANGTIDIPSVSLSILAIYFFVLGVEKNQKYFYLAFPVVVLGFFAKYTAGLVLPLMLLYLLFKPNIIQNIKKYWKNTVGGLVAGIMVAVPFLAYFYINKIPLGFLNQAQEIASKTTTVPEVSNDLFYYFTNIPRFIYNPNHILSYIIIIITIIGLGIGLYKATKVLGDLSKTSNNNIHNKSVSNSLSNNLSNKKLDIIGKKLSNKIFYILLFITFVIIAISFLTASKMSFVYNELIFFVGVFVLSYLINKIINVYSNDIKTSKSFRFDLLMFSWFFSYMIFFSAHLVKADRYFTTLAPGFVFIATLALNFILNSKPIYKKTLTSAKSSFNLKLKNLIPISLIILFIISSFGYLTIDKHDYLVNDERETVKWLENHDPLYKSKIIWAERGPIFTWYLKQEVFYVNWNYSTEKLSTMMKGNNTTYFISIHPETDIPDYTMIKRIGNIIIYERNRS
jgi:4-amino-4-deoxy-L-arabinose transferase-like glycosyltransferase